MEKSVRGRRARLESGAPNPIDVHVGGRVRLRRTLMGLSQTELSDRLGLTFQQVQKYERGDNRISASRLFDIARVLKIPISFFFDDMPDDVKNRAPGSVKDHPARAEDAEANLMGRRETLDLVRAYYQIIDSEVRKRVYDLARLLGK